MMAAISPAFRCLYAIPPTGCGADGDGNPAAVASAECDACNVA